MVFIYVPYLLRVLVIQIEEAMSIGALVVTTDLAPMNELVDESRSILVPVSSTKPKFHALAGVISPDALEDAIERTIRLTDFEWESRSRAAREWFVANDTDFRFRLSKFADGLR